MSDNPTTAPAEPEAVTEKPKAPKAPRRVTLTHPKMKGEANPMSDALEPWFAAGWVRK
ncbi:hypothetical protein [Sagittula sp. S175]|uniref:hypothetical protein n=1 Tax=Sagittula sp. S175 TaxID=3415129 RepID=UPI003C7B087C